MQENKAGTCRSPFDLLPFEIMALIMNKLKTEEKLQVAPLVCRTWHHVCQTEALVWETVDLEDWEDKHDIIDLYNVLEPLAERAGASLRTLNVDCIDYDKLEEVVTAAKGSLEWLRVGSCDMTNTWAKEFAPTLSKLKYLDVSECDNLRGPGIAAFGRNCPSLTELYVSPTCNRDCLAIERCMPNLKRLHVFTDTPDQNLEKGMLSVLQRCTNLQSMTLSTCMYTYNKGYGPSPKQFTYINVVRSKVRKTLRKACRKLRRGAGTSFHLSFQ